MHLLKKRGTDYVRSLKNSVLDTILCSGTLSSRKPGSWLNPNCTVLNLIRRTTESLWLSFLFCKMGTPQLCGQSVKNFTRMLWSKQLQSAVQIRPSCFSFTLRWHNIYFADGNTLFQVPWCWKCTEQGGINSGEDNRGVFAENKRTLNRRTESSTHWWTKTQKLEDFIQTTRKYVPVNTSSITRSCPRY